MVLVCEVGFGCEGRGQEGEGKRVGKGVSCGNGIDNYVIQLEVCLKR